MDKKIEDVMIACTKASDESTMAFPDVVGKLMEAGVKRYYADLVRAEKIYYLPNGDSARIPSTPVKAVFAETFSASGVEAAIRKSQKGEIDYKTFCSLVAAAGCVSYVVSLTGQRAVYSGRSGETHVELFPKVD